MSHFYITPVKIEIIVGEHDSTSIITSFKHRLTNKDLDFYVVGKWLIDMEDEVEFPKEQGYYVMKADWHDDKEMIMCIYDIEKIR